MRSVVARAVFAVLVSVLLAPAARAESVFGVEVYPGARRHELADEYCRRFDISLKTVRCFRTTDDFSKVLAFYAKQSVLEETEFSRSMPKMFRDNLINGPKKVWEWCRKGKDEQCEAFIPAVRIASPWSDNLNLSPATPPEEYPAKDVIIFIRAHQ